MKRSLVGFGSLLALVFLIPSLSALTPAERQAYLDWMKTTLPDVPSWTTWQQTTGELPPDFDALPRMSGLPDPLRFLDGRPVRNAREWSARRAEILKLFEQYAFGTLPPKPKLDRAVVTEEVTYEGYRTRQVRLEFGPEGKGSLRVTLAIPDGTAARPVLVSPGIAAWEPALVRRGYIAVGYAGSDRQDDAAALAELYPDYDFALLPRRAWAAQLVMDYLHTLPEVDKARIAITGFSRDGKMATIAAAIDERFAAVVAMSTGTGGTFPYRLAGERNAAEGIESGTRMFPTWFHPRLRFFAGREDRLPVDGNSLVALLAPRACLIEFGLNDWVSSAWANEQSFNSARPVWELLKQPSRLGLYRRPGFHSSSTEVREACIDWLDLQFGRSTTPWDNDPLFPYDFETWRARSQEKVDLKRYPKRAAGDFLQAADGRAIASPAAWSARAEEIRAAVKWTLGDAPPRLPVPAGPPAPPPRPGGNPQQVVPDLVAAVTSQTGNPSEFGWSLPEREQVDSKRIAFGYSVAGDLYTPNGVAEGTKLPVVIWLHGPSYPIGYMWVYRRDLHPILALTKAGYAVFAFDQTGFGSRMNETKHFFDRHPQWSQLGRMVEDVHAAIDALAKEPRADAEQVSLFGYSLGGAVGLHAAALDARVKHVVSISGFTPMRTDTADRGTGGIARYSHERGLLPRLGFFIGHESQVPYDYPELIAAIAPRSVLVVQPTLDRDANPADVRAGVEQARKVFALHGAADRLTLREPVDYTRLPAATQDAIIAWLKAQSK